MNAPPHRRGFPLLRRFTAAFLIFITATPAAFLLFHPNHGPAPAAGPGLELATTIVRANAPVPSIRHPRDIETGPAGDLYLVDRTATVHRLDRDGRLVASFPMPLQGRGNPQGLSVTEDGRILVADTHYNRVVTLSASGACVKAFGEYGTDPGQFIYPTDVVEDGAGRIYVSEYGGNDRVQVFTALGTHVKTIGQCGKAPGSFRRPAGLAFDHEGNLWVADACNHRLQCFSPEGDLLRVVGAFGHGPGDFHYPFDVTVTPWGTVAVVEYGNNRIQEISRDGKSLRCFGTPGPGLGQFHNPWGIAASPTGLVVSDTWNHRVQFIPGATRPWRVSILNHRPGAPIKTP